LQYISFINTSNITNLSIYSSLWNERWTHRRPPFSMNVMSLRFTIRQRKLLRCIEKSEYRLHPLQFRFSFSSSRKNDTYAMRRQPSYQRMTSIAKMEWPTPSTNRRVRRMWQMLLVKHGLFIDDTTFQAISLQSVSMANWFIVCIGLLCLASAWSASLNIEGSSKRVLVLLDNLAIRESHSFYFKQLKGEI
jgi:hypothetical protein